MLAKLRPAIVIAFLMYSVTLRPVRGEEGSELKRDFEKVIQPFVKAHCINCHGKEKPRAKFTLSPYVTLDSVTGDMAHWKLVLERLRANEMPPAKAKEKPTEEARERVVQWILRLQKHEAAKAAGDPGTVLARRLSNSEYNYVIHDLTGSDIRPTRNFPVDPANRAGFDNSGESLTMSPALLKKYLGAAQEVADHLVLLPESIGFAPHPVVVYSDRDKYSVHRIVNFYRKQPTDYADYFYAAWRYQHRQQLANPNATLEDVAKADKVSVKYLRVVWGLLTDDKEDAGPIATLREKWKGLPGPGTKTETVRDACEKLRDLVQEKREELQIPVGNQYSVAQLNKSSQPLILWKDRDIAANRRRGKLPPADGKPETEKLRKSIARFCSTYPDVFYVPERGRMFLKAGLDKATTLGKRSEGRLLSAGFHLMLGYFRDDQPLYDLILDEAQQKHLDQMWRELIFVTEAPKRQFSDYIYFERAEYPAILKEKEFDFAREDAEITSQAKIKRLAKEYLAKCRERGIDAKVIKVIDEFFKETAANVLQLEKAKTKSEPMHLKALVEFAERAWQRPLSKADREDLIGFYRVSREKIGLNHEQAVRDTLVSILMSPRFFYRTTEAKPGRKPQPLSDHELASRLSYFLWASIPDAELRKRADEGELHNPKVLLQQTRRMLNDPRITRFAVEFAGNWLDFRRFGSHAGVNRERFPTFTDDLRQAMYEEPIRFVTDLIQRDGSVLDLIHAKHTFVNKTLADHYGMPFSGKDPKAWVKIDKADRYGRGGLLPMSVFLTKNAPGLRTSPVKRGYWVVRRVLGEHVPAPPADVPEIPADEAKLGKLSVRDVLVKHREVQSCAKCHQRFDSIGLVFEGYGPIGERRTKDLGGRPVDASAEFPDGSKGEGVEGLKRYLRKSRQDDLVDNLCRKLLSYALGRSLLLSDEATIRLMKERLVANRYRFGVLVETIVSSPQFLRSRGRDQTSALK